MGCCLTIVLAFIALAVAFFYVTASLVILDIVFLLMIISSAIRVNNASKTRPSKMICPNCKSKSVKLSTKQSGTSAGGFFYGHGIWGNTSVHYKRVAICQECGFEWDYIIAEDIRSEKAKATASFTINVILFSICLILTLWMVGTY